MRSFARAIRLAGGVFGRARTYFGLVMVCAALGAGPASQPATAPSTLTGVKAAMADLSDPQEGVRDRARIALMGLGREQLALVKKAIEDAGGLDPSQAAAIREIVMQVYLAGEAYNKTDQAFLGVFLPREMDIPADDDGASSVVVEGRLPGFCSYRMLQDGDVITEFEEREQPKLRNKVDLIETVAQHNAGETIHLKVLRQGKMLRIPIVLDAKPEEARGLGAATWIEEFKNARQAAAEKYWRENFGRLVEKARPG